MIGRGIEDLAIEGAALIDDLHLVGRLRNRSVSLDQHLVLQTVRKGVDPRLQLVLGEEFLASNLVGLLALDLGSLARILKLCLGLCHRIGGGILAERGLETHDYHLLAEGLGSALEVGTHAREHLLVEHRGYLLACHESLVCLVVALGISLLEATDDIGHLALIDTKLLLQIPVETIGHGVTGSIADRVGLSLERLRLDCLRLGRHFLDLLCAHRSTNCTSDEGK